MRALRAELDGELLRAQAAIAAYDAAAATLAKKLERAEAELKDAKDKLMQACGERKEAHEALAARDPEIAGIMRSWSVRITAPMRRGAALFRSGR